jgi:hypothetical protein
MFLRFILICALACSTLPLAARTKPAPPPLDPDYLAALAAANNFLHAWQAHDEESGMLLLSDQLREHSTIAAVSSFFSAHPQQTYEIARGRKLSAGRYQFPITLWQAPTISAGFPHLKPHAATLVVTCTPKDDWLIDNLP